MAATAIHPGRQAGSPLSASQEDRTTDAPCQKKTRIQFSTRNSDGINAHCGRPGDRSSHAVVLCHSATATGQNCGTRTITAAAMATTKAPTALRTRPCLRRSLGDVSVPKREFDEGEGRTDRDMDTHRGAAWTPSAAPLGPHLWLYGFGRNRQSAASPGRRVLIAAIDDNAQVCSMASSLWCPFRSVVPFWRSQAPKP
jgi:hypothetical protein